MPRIGRMDFPVNWEGRLRPRIIQQTIYRAVASTSNDAAQIIHPMTQRTILPFAALTASFLTLEECFPTFKAIAAHGFAARVGSMYTMTIRDLGTPASSDIVGPGCVSSFFQRYTKRD